LSRRLGERTQQQACNDDGAFHGIQPGFPYVAERAVQVQVKKFRLTDNANQCTRQIETDELRPAARLMPGPYSGRRSDHNRGYLLFAVIYCCLQ
jgi:hypothetical protein